MNKEKVFAWIESLEDMADQSDKYFVERTELYKENQEKDKEIERLNNIIDTILEFPFFEQECPLNFGFNEKELEEKAQDVFYEDEWCENNCKDEYKKCWLKYFERLKELKEGK